jgi:hypothetical protein
MTRRDFLLGAPALSAVPGKRPNIVLIMADDMGFSDLGCYGSEIPTPNIDALARRGIRFTQFYNAARCCPTRASTAAGLYPHQAGVGHMGRDLGYPAYQGCLNDRCVTVAEALRAAGYRTLMSGKWHGVEEGRQADTNFRTQLTRMELPYVMGIQFRDGMASRGSAQTGTTVQRHGASAAVAPARYRPSTDPDQTTGARTAGHGMETNHVARRPR